MYINVDLLALASNANYFSTLGISANGTGNSTLTAPSLLVYDQSFATNVLGPNATASLVTQLPWQAFHEAGIYHKADNSIYTASNFNPPDSLPNITVISLDDLSVRTTHFPNLVAANGGTSYYPPCDASDYHSNPNASLAQRPPLQVWADEGDLDSPSQLIAVDPSSNTSTVLVSSFLGGRNFSSLNDVRQHPVTGELWFTDADYGYFQDFRPASQINKQVYRFNPKTGALAAAADGFIEPNGLEFSPDLRTLYVTDTGAEEQSGNFTRPASIYAFDIFANNRTIGNRRLFAYSDNGVPDGIHADTQGNVWANCGDGVHVWNEDGQLIGKFWTGEVSNNMAFYPGGALIFGNDKLFKLDGILAQGREVCKDFGVGCSVDDESAGNATVAGMRRRV